MLTKLDYKSFPKVEVLNSLFARAGLLTITLLLCSIYLGEGWQNTDTVKPFLYRQLVPTLAWFAERVLPVTATLAVKGILFLCSVGLVESARYLYLSIYGDSLHSSIFVFLYTLMVFLFAMFPAHTYDLPTAFLFTLALGLLARRKLTAFVCLFPIITINRETSFILIILFVAWCWNKLPRKKLVTLTLVMIVSYLVVQLTIRYALRGISNSYPALPLLESFQVASVSYAIIFSHLLLGLLLVALLQAKWNSLPSFLRTSLLVFVPSLTILYILFGWPFEFRAFLEGLPLLVLLGLHR